MAFAAQGVSVGKGFLRSGQPSRCIHSFKSVQPLLMRARRRPLPSRQQVDYRRASYAMLSNRSMLYLSGGGEGAAMFLEVDKRRTLLLISSLSVAAETDQSADKAADALKAHLQELEDERKAATLKAEHMATKSQRLAEAIENLQAGALRAMRQQDEAAARELLQVGTINDHIGHDL